MAEWLRPEHVALGVMVTDRRGAFRAVGELVHRPRGPSVHEVAKRLARREGIRSTALGRGAALPHAQVPHLLRPLVAYLRTRHPIAFDAPDGWPVTDILALLVPVPAMATHFDLLQRLTRRFADPALRTALADCRSAASVCQLFALRPDDSDITGHRAVLHEDAALALCSTHDLMCP